MTTQIERQIAQHMEILVNHIGERPGGSPGCQQAEDYVESIFAGPGWTTERQAFQCPAWVDLGTELMINGRLFAAYSNAYSPPCAVRAETVAVSTLAELESAELAGRIALIYGALLTSPLSPKSWFLKSEREDRIIQLLEDKQPAALITVQKIGGGVERLIEDWEFHIPSATVSAEIGRELLLARGPVVELQIKSSSEQGSTANIIGRSQEQDNRVVLCAHHDTKYGTPGACDNASGVAVLLALAESLSPRDYPFGLELVSFSNEEYLPIGDDEYLRRNGGDDLSDVLACINTDGVGQLLAPDSITAINAGDEFTGAISRLAAEHKDIEWADPWPESNHSTFAWRGVPSVAFTSTNRVALAHHPYDDLTWSSSRRISRLIPIIQEILSLLAENPPQWSRAQ
ncbi:MAG: M28 family peptidase [Candidatus Promineifilaceae bacterium]